MMKQSAGRTLGSGILVPLTVLFLGCASAPPSARIETSAATIRAAEEVGAAKIPAASLHLQLAKEQAEHARSLMETGGENERFDAELLLMRAQADAELALALAREDTDRAAAQQAVDRVRSLQPTN